MGKGNAAVSRALNCISEAPFDPDKWPEAMKFLGDATGSSFAQIAGWISPGRLPLSIHWNEPDGMIKRWVELGGADPAVNPVIRVGRTTRELQIVSDAEFISAEDRKKLAIWADFYEPYDLPHICLTPLWRDRSADLMLAVCRSAKAGAIGPDERKAFHVIALRCREAAMLTQAVKSEGARLLRGALDALSVAAFAFNSFGQVVSFSENAERLLREAKLVKLNCGRLACMSAKDTEKLNHALTNCSSESGLPPSPTSVDVSGRDGSLARLRFSQLPRARNDIGFGAVALAVVEEVARPTSPHRVALGLTAAEREVSLALLKGERPAQIARHRGVSINTVRSQVKSIYAKAGVAGYVEFLAKARFEQ